MSKISMVADPENPHSIWISVNAFWVLFIGGVPIASTYTYTHSIDTTVGPESEFYLKNAFERWKKHVTNLKLEKKDHAIHFINQFELTNRFQEQFSHFLLEAPK